MNYPIDVKIITDSTSPTGNRMITYELSHPRYIHSEFLKHRILSSNSQSSRAIPSKKTQDVNTQHVKPLVWGKNKAGMSSTEVLTGWRLGVSKALWNVSAKMSFFVAGLLTKLGLHKQWVNRITEPYSTIKVIVSGTEWDNFFWLRQDPEAAQPEIVALADKMKQAKDMSIPVQLPVGFWHIPYVYWENHEGKQKFYDADFKELTEEEALMISASCCAQISYRVLNTSKEKAISIYHKLFAGTRPHLTPTEHQGKVMKESKSFYVSANGTEWEDGITAMNSKMELLSGNLKGFIQYRQLLDNKNKKN